MMNNIALVEMIFFDFIFGLGAPNAEIDRLIYV